MVAHLSQECATHLSPSPLKGSPLKGSLNFFILFLNLVGANLIGFGFLIHGPCFVAKYGMVLRCGDVALCGAMLVSKNFPTNLTVLTTASRGLLIFLLKALAVDSCFNDGFLDANGSAVPSISISSEGQWCFLLNILCNIPPQLVTGHRHTHICSLYM